MFRNLSRCEHKYSRNPLRIRNITTLMAACVVSAYQVVLEEGKIRSRTTIPAIIIKNGAINVRRNVKSFLVDSPRYRNAKDIVAEAYSVNPNADPAATPDIP